MPDPSPVLTGQSATRTRVPRERSYRIHVDWTPAKIRRAKASADSGHLWMAADLVDNLLTDERILSAVDTRLKGLLRFNTLFQTADGEEVEGDPVLEALSADYARMYPEQDLYQLMRWGVLLGVGLAAHDWMEDPDTGRLLPRLDVWSSRWLRRDFERDEWHLDTRDGTIRIEPGDTRWVMYTPTGQKRPWEGGAWRALAPWYLLKRFALQDWALYGEAHGNPTKVARHTEPLAGSNTKAQREELVEDLSDLVGTNAIALPDGWDMALVEARADTWETYQAQIEAAAAGIAIAIKGQNLTTEVTGGSYAAARVHSEVEATVIEADEQTISTTLHEQSIRFWAGFNFGDEQPVPWIRWDTTPPEDRELFAYHLEYGIVTVNEARAYLGLPELEDGSGDERPLPIAATPTGSEDPRALEAGMVRLANHHDGEPILGFVNGQLYTDELAERRPNLEQFQQTLERIVSGIREASTYAEAFRAIREALDGVDPADARALREALVLADLAGRAAVMEDQ